MRTTTILAIINTTMVVNGELTEAHSVPARPSRIKSQAAALKLSFESSYKTESMFGTYKQVSGMTRRTTIPEIPPTPVYSVALHHRVAVI